MHNRGTELENEKVKRTGSALYISDTQDTDGAALRLGLEARTKGRLSFFELGGGDGHGGTGAENGGGDEGKEVHI